MTFPSTPSHHGILVDIADSLSAKLSAYYGIRDELPKNYTETLVALHDLRTKLIVAPNLQTFSPSWPMFKTLERTAIALLPFRGLNGNDLVAKIYPILTYGHAKPYILSTCRCDLIQSDAEVRMSVTGLQSTNASFIVRENDVLGETIDVPDIESNTFFGKSLYINPPSEDDWDTTLEIDGTDREYILYIFLSALLERFPEARRIRLPGSGIGTDTFVVSLCPQGSVTLDPMSGEDSESVLHPLVLHRPYAMGE